MLKTLVGNEQGHAGWQEVCDPVRLTILSLMDSSVTNDEKQEAERGHPHLGVGAGSPIDEQPSLVVRRSFPVRLLKKLLVAGRALVPAPLYRVLFNASYSIYKAGLRMLYWRKVLVYSLSDDKENYDMAKTVRRAMRYSLVGSPGLEATYRAAAEVGRDQIDGSFVECGVAQGGCAALMATVASRYKDGRAVWLFDSFEGLPDPSEKDFGGTDGKITGQHIRPLDKGSCLGTIEQVKELMFTEFKFDKEKIKLVKGWFQDTLPVYRKELGPIAILRIDADWYDSTRCCLENLYDNLVVGGYCIVDDYDTCYGCQRAVDEFMQKRRMSIQYIPDGRGGILFRHPA